MPVSELRGGPAQLSNFPVTGWQGKVLRLCQPAAWVGAEAAPSPAREQAGGQDGVPEAAPALSRCCAEGASG